MDTRRVRWSDRSRGVVAPSRSVDMRMTQLLPWKVRWARRCAEWGVYALVVAVTASSAVVAKRWTSAPALAAVDLRAVETGSSLVGAEAAPTETADATGVLDDLELSGEAATRYFDGREIRPVRRVWMTVTAYSPDERSCGIYADGITASGKSVWTNGGELVAADRTWFAFGDLVSVPGYAGDRVVPVLDRGGAIKGARLDVLYPTHEVAMRWGVQRLPVTVWEYAD